MHQEESYRTTGYSYYFEDNEAITSMLDEIPDTDFYRVEKITRKTKNDAAWNDYHGVSVFSSTASAHFTNYLGSLGFEKSTNAYSYYGSTPFSSALLSVRYLIGNEAGIELEEDYTLISSRVDQSRYLYKVNNTLPLGFMVPSQFDTLWNMSGNNPFAVQNSFAENATGITGMFTQVEATNAGNTTYINVEKDSDIYIYCTTYVESIDYSITNTEEGLFDSGSASGLKHRQIVHIGKVPAGTTIDVTTSDSVSSLQLYAYSLDSEVLDQVLEAMGDEGLEVVEYDDTYILGTINAKTSGLMYTSIIYDEGWTAYVDGKEVELSSIKDALIAIPVPEGTHTVELRYTPEGYVKGWFITIASVIVLVCCALYDKKRRDVKSSK